MNNNKLYICKHCIKEFQDKTYVSPFQYRGLFTNFKVPEDNICPTCKSNLYETQVTMDEIKILFAVSHDNKFLMSMIDLKESDPIEYQLKMSQFKTQVEQQKKTVEDNTPKCPYCNSNDLKRITTTAKAVNIAMFGLLGNKRKYQWHCNNCKSDF